MTAPARTRGVPFAQDLAAHGDQPALLTAKEVVSYRDLAARVTAAVATLGPTRRLVLLTPTPDVDTVVTYLACLAGGHPVLLTAPEQAARLTAAYDPDVVVSGDLVERREGTAHDLHPDLALLLSTSGSTGSAKLVRLSGHSVQANAAAIADSLGIRGTDRAITSLPLHYCYGLSVLHSHLLRGAATVLTSLSVVDPCFWNLFRSHQATTLAGVPHTFALLDRVRFEELDLPHLRYVTQAGGRLAPTQVRRFAELGQRRGWDLVVMYGQTEATARMACLPAGLALSHPSAIGLPVAGGSFELLPSDDDRDVGELVYCGPNVMLGYASGPADLSLGRTVERLRTGDLARVRDGVYEIVGRRSRFLKVFGQRIDLDAVETALGSGVACLGTDDELVVAVEDGDLPAVRRKAAQAAGLPLSAVRAVAVAALPRTSAGKLDGVALASLTRPTPVPVTPAASVAGVFAQALGRDDITVDSTFVGLGGDSLSYVEVSLRLEQLLGYLPEGWHLATVAALQGTESRSRRAGRAIEIGVLLRAVAIVLIVAHHAHLFKVLGGAHVLLGVAGFNFARFHLTSVDRRERLRGLGRRTARLVLPAMAAVGVTTLFMGRYTWEHLLLVHDLIDPGGGYKHFWFAEVLVQTIVVCGLVVAVPTLDRLERRLPMVVPSALLGLGLLARFDIVPAVDGKARLYAPAAIFWLFAWGWLAARARTNGQRLLLTAVLLLAMPGFFQGSTQRELLVGAGLLLLLWIRQVRVPAATVPLLGLLATSSLYVYLAHYLVVKDVAEPWLAFFASFAVGLGYWQVATRAMARLEATWSTAVTGDRA